MTGSFSNWQDRLEWRVVEADVTSVNVTVADPDSNYQFAVQANQVSISPFILASRAGFLPSPVIFLFNFFFNLFPP